MTKVVETRRVAEDADALWANIGKFGAVGEWHPMLAGVDSEGEREGCLRVAKGQDGSRQTERLLETEPEHHLYRYRMEETAMPVRHYSAEFRVDDNGDGTSTVVWSAVFEPMPDGSKAVEVIRQFLKAGLDNISSMHGGATA
ncbi:MxaD protein (plasmid) [Neorhizobium galegae bv. officinalis bv. officinalis str. HAMBI 1141]|jgi:mxaD protein|uniref:MxaD protein n=1 Tax=Neorhizobium galegae bv. officinalis bv. officinalis str. HAMBI 1141 TaxID=1028801 RepID=A0A068TIN3_NEOGA|nr:SRPBCC family protein [Neorhizobium galegae]CDN57901.1 MxaD protein [Neorhizobium galegae bv. officinalis bv. officinalis str. HAMBI 1141]